MGVGHTRVSLFGELHVHRQNAVVETLHLGQFPFRMCPQLLGHVGVLTLHRHLQWEPPACVTNGSDRSEFYKKTRPQLDKQRGTPPASAGMPDPKAAEAEARDDAFDLAGAGLMECQSSPGQRTAGGGDIVDA